MAHSLATLPSSWLAFPSLPSPWRPSAVCVSAGSSLSAAQLESRITDHLTNLPADAQISTSEIIGFLRGAHAEYAAVPAAEFTRTVEELCDQMRRQAEAENEGDDMADVEDVSDVVITSSVTPTGTGAPGGSSGASVSASSPPSVQDKKRRKGANGAAAVTAINIASDIESDEDDDEDDDGFDPKKMAQVVDSNLANSAMRNLYNRGKTTPNDDAAAAASAKYVPNPQKPREKKSDKDHVYTQNSKKPQSAKKKAQALKNKVTNVHFNQTSAGPDDAPGEGGAWHPEVLYPKASYADLGGIEGILQEIHELIEYPLTHPEIYQHLGIQPPRGVLLHGPPGCGQKQEGQGRRRGLRRRLFWLVVWALIHLSFECVSVCVCVLR